MTVSVSTGRLELEPPRLIHQDPLTGVERAILLNQLRLVAYSLVGLQNPRYENELCTCDPEWSSHAPGCGWLLALEGIDTVERRIGSLEAGV